MSAANVVATIDVPTTHQGKERPERKYSLFGSGGGKQLAEENGVPLLAQIPMEMLVLEGGNEGWPIVKEYPDSLSAKAFEELAISILRTIKTN